MNLFLAILGAIGGLSALIMFFVFIRQNKRIKDNEADGGEIENLTKIIAELKTARADDKIEREELRARVEVLEKRDVEREKLVIDIERNLNIHKRAINAQLECVYEQSHNCPVIKKLNDLSK